jgi:hypothetical protein
MYEKNNFHHQGYVQEDDQLSSSLTVGIRSGISRESAPDLLSSSRYLEIEARTADVVSWCCE